MRTPRVCCFTPGGQLLANGTDVHWRCFQCYASLLTTWVIFASPNCMEHFRPRHDPSHPRLEIERSDFCVIASGHQHRCVLVEPIEIDLGDQYF